MHTLPFLFFICRKCFHLQPRIQHQTINGGFYLFGGATQDFYRRFALDHPTSYAVMFERVVPGYEPTESAQIIANGTFELLVGRVRRAMELGALPAADALETAQRIWAACHGWVSLEIHGLIKIDDPDGAAFERSMVALCGPIELSAPPPRATRASAPRSTRRRG